MSVLVPLLCDVSPVLSLNSHKTYFHYTLLESLQFFNVSDMVFEHQSALYLIYATVSAFILHKLHVCSNTFTFHLRTWRMALISSLLPTITSSVIYNG